TDLTSREPQRCAARAKRESVMPITVRAERTGARHLRRPVGPRAPSCRGTVREDIRRGRRDDPPDTVPEDRACAALARLPTEAETSIGSVEALLARPRCGARACTSRTPCLPAEAGS